MTDDRLGLLIKIPARAENVAVIRHALAGLAERLGMEEPTLGDLKTVVTEACMNVVVHAYDGDEPGPLQVEARVEGRGLTVSVRDFGRGIRPTADDERQSLRIGLTLIAALSSSFSIAGGLGKGTEVTMRLLIDSATEDESEDGGIPGAISEQAELQIDGSDVVAPVLERVIGALAARHPIGIDRLNDVFLLADAVSDRAPRVFQDGPYRFAVGDGDGGIDLRVGPLPAGASERLRSGLSLPEVGGSLETLADSVEVEEAEAGEYLVVRFDSVAQGA